MLSPTAARVARALYIALLAWQVAWLALLPSPHGKNNWILATVLTLPLFIPLTGVVRLQARALIWAGYLVVFCFVFGVTEWWSAPGQRPAAAIETLLALGFLGALFQATRRRR